ncbi:MAG TPA: glycosyltransferase family 4 protein [Phycisphaerae bacterium]|nr:glycosyltransferase family 4 protein [Phycisphaerae bacterium]
MRITFLVLGRGLIGGVKVLGEYAGRLRARGHDVNVLYRRPARNLKRWMQRWITRRAPDALDESGCPLTAVGDFSADVVPDADVVVTTGLRAVREAASLPPEKGQVVEIVQGMLQMEEEPQEARRAMALPVRRVAVSPAVADYLQTTFGQTAAVVPNGVDHSQLYNNDRKFRLPRTVGMIYAPGEMKGTAEGFDAMRLIRDQWPDVRLVMYGAERPRSAPPRTDVFVRPKTRRLRTIYSTCEVWLAPSRSEGFGLPVLEAMACGVVPVATRSGGHECIVEDEVSGFLVPVGDAEAMARRIGLLLDDESLLRKMCEAAGRRSREFDWDTSTEHLETLLTDWAVARG